MRKAPTLAAWGQNRQRLGRGEQCDGYDGHPAMRQYESHRAASGVKPADAM